MNPIQAVVTCFNNFATFTGRASRSEYWWFMLFIIVIFVISICLGIFMVMSAGFGANIINNIIDILILVTFLPNIAVTVRRMHDTGHSGWYCLIPIYNLILCCTAGDEGENEYGENPLNLD